ncbi:MAG: hypothetical protein QOJ16_1895 [Acidobacteriota bacterium]|jgi:hypothetical protein|nr:hypothetical protein [Acidobacteriota bacterium]
MTETFLLLERSLRDDLKILDRIYADLGEPQLAESEPADKLIVVGYRLHGIYNAFENMFRNIAAAFEKSRDDHSGWHQQLLQSMRLDLSPIRPAVIDDPAYEKLDELRRFRHLFRAAYGIDLDPLRLQLVIRKALELRTLYPPQIDRFLQFLRDLR